MQEPIGIGRRASSDVSSYMSLYVSLCASIALAAGCAATAPPALTTTQIATILASPDRSVADRTNDVRRKPVEMLTFIGVRPGITALDVSAGGGYTTELLARAVGPTGRVYGQSAPPDPARVPPAVPEGGIAPAAMAPRRTTAMLLAERAQHPAAANIVAVLAPWDDPVPSEIAPQSLDLVTFMFNYHDLGHMGTDRGSLNRAIFAALKPGGLYVIADHAGRAGTGISESGTLHRVEEAFVVREVEAAGFRLVARGDFLHNPDDPRDRNEPDPPMPKDEFVLKFVK
jgi:predicted methyltransferase